MESDEDKKRRRTRFLETGFICGKHILDVGTGPLALIAAKDFGCKVTSIDIDDEKLEEYRGAAAAAGITTIEFLHEDALALSFPDQSFEAVVCYAALHHIPEKDRERFLSEIWRVTEKKLILSELSPGLFEEIHPNEEYPKVDFEWLESRLNALGVYKKYEREELNMYIVMRR